MIFGHQELFAIEVNKLPEKSLSCLLPLRIWINSIPLGGFEDETYIPVFIGRLERCISNQIALPAEIAHLGSREKFDYLSDDETTGEYVAGLGDSFDDYQIYYFHDAGYILFLWKLCENTFSSYNYGYDHNDLFEFKLRKEVIEKSIADFKSAIEKNIVRSDKK